MKAIDIQPYLKPYEALEIDLTWELREINIPAHVKPLRSYRLKSTIGTSLMGDMVRMAIKFPHNASKYMEYAKRIARRMLATGSPYLKG